MKFNQFIKFLKPHLTSLNLLIGFFILGSLLVFLIVASQNNWWRKTAKIGQKQIQMKDESSLLTVNDSGAANFKGPSEAFNQKWDKDKTEDIFQYFGEKAKNAGLDGFNLVLVEEEIDSYKLTFQSDDKEVIIFVNKDDTEIKSIFSLAANLSASQGDLSDYFDFSSPTPPPATDGDQGDDSDDSDGDDGTPGNGDSGNGDSGGANGNSGTPGGDPGSVIDDCPFWRLNYCVYPPAPPPIPSSPTPTPSPGPSPTPGSSPQPTPDFGVVQDEPDCSLWDEWVTTRAIISNTLCIKEEE